MEIGVIAAALNKPAEELKTAYNITDDKIDETTLKSILSKEIDLVSKQSFKSGKDEGFNWGTREIKSKVEKQLKSEFEIDGDLDTIITTLKTKMQPDDPKKHEAYKHEIETYKAKLQNINAQFDTFKSEVENEKKTSKIKSKIDSVLPIFFETSNSKLKDVAVREFLNSYSIEEIDGSVMVFDKEKRPIYKQFDDLTQEFFKDFLPLKEAKKAAPTIPNDPTKMFSPNGQSKDQLLKELSKAKTGDERAAILEKIKSMEK